MEQKVNYQKEYEKTIAQLDDRSHSLLLHCCCAPCASHCLSVTAERFDVSAFFYNPNIFPPDEYFIRLNELKRLVESMPLPRKVSVIEGDYEPDDFFAVSAGLENAPERGERCKKCFLLRLSETARTAKKQGYEYFGTTLTLSPLKDARLINETGKKLADIYCVKWLPADFKKHNGYLHSIELSNQYGLYRQNYCGCVFSRNGTKT